MIKLDFKEVLSENNKTCQIDQIFSSILRLERYKFYNVFMMKSVYLTM